MQLLLGQTVREERKEKNPCIYWASKRMLTKLITKFALASDHLLEAGSSDNYAMFMEGSLIFYTT